MTDNKWNGFEKKEFEFEGRNAIIVFPHKSNATNKWCFKTEYWDAFPSLEIEMAKHGWHIAYIENQTRWCLDEDLDLKQRFADFIIKEYNLCEKCIPVGMSCGGMFAVKFAAKYPQYVSALYLDAPVINLLSCPADIGISQSGMFDEFTNATRVSLSQLICYREHPLDKLDILIENKIPTILVYGKEDEIVPYCENGIFVEQKYIGSGVDFTAIGKDNCGHHPHGLVDPSPIVKFLLSHCE